jgi:hypothetical protein
MKRFFTDYPIVELGDTPGESAPIREIEAGFSFDGDKYVRVLVGGHREGKILVGAVQVSLKYFYIFHKVGEYYVPMTYDETSAIFKN